MVFDNCNDIDPVKFQQLIPGVGSGSVLVTTRRSGARNLGVLQEVREIEKEGVVLIISKHWQN